jgi:hypothetical protein
MLNRLTILQVNKHQVFSIRVMFQRVNYSNKIIILIQPIFLILVKLHKHLFSRIVNLSKNLCLNSLHLSLKISNHKQIIPLLALIKPQLINRLLNQTISGFYLANYQAINPRKLIDYLKRKKLKLIHF